MLQVSHLMTILKPLKVELGEVIAHSGTPGQQMYIISHGTVDAVTDEGSVMRRMGKGEVLGLPNALGVRDVWNWTLIAGQA